jgi:hypothetical protein
MQDARDNFDLADLPEEGLGVGRGLGFGAAAAAAAGGVAGGEAAAAAAGGQRYFEPLLLEDVPSGLRLQVPGSVNRSLRAYQREGVRFLFKLYAQRMGGVLSDDMGLGKTLQVRRSNPTQWVSNVCLHFLC